MTNHLPPITRRSILGGLGAAGLGAAVLRHQTARATMPFVGTLTPQELYVTSPSELSNALSQAQPGDSVVLQDRVWTSLAVVIADNAQHGQPGAPITLRAETRGGVTLSGASSINLARNYWVIDGLKFRDGYLPNGDRGVIYFGLPLTGGGHAEAHHCEVTHVSIQDYNPTNPAVQYNWVRMMGTNHTVSHSHFSGKNHYLDMVAAHWRKASPTTPTRHWFHHNYFGDIEYASGNGYGALTPVQGGSPLESDHNLVEDNVFHRCNGESEIISLKSSGNVVRNNTFIECIGYVSIRMGNDNEVSGNYIFGNNAQAEPWYPGGVPLGESGGIRVTGQRQRIFNNYIHDVAGSAFFIHNGASNNPATGYPAVKDVAIVHNTVVNSGLAAFTIGAGISTTTAGGDNVVPENLTIANNIMVGDGTEFSVQYGAWPWPTFENETEPVNLHFEGNLAHGSPAHELPVPEGIHTADPELVDAGHPEPVLRPGAGSPAIGAGEGKYTDVNKDIEGRPRPKPRDIGAHEDSQGPVHHPPLNPTDIGPSYLDLGQ